MKRFSLHTRVFYIEEPAFDTTIDNCTINQADDNLWIVVPHLEPGLSHEEIICRQKDLISKMFIEMNITSYFFWYYTPMSLAISDHLYPEIIVYDCMDELSAFKNAPAALREREKELFNIADVVFTGGYSLYEAKKHQHKNIYAFPSSIDKEHFAKARTEKDEPADQRDIPHPCIGFFGVIDERFDIDLISEVAERKPEWHFVILGPVVKIDPASLPQIDNIHYLGSKSYDELPSYISGWDIAMIPFARNESTEFISPTKTPEYLAAGKPVISTSIKDVVRTYGNNGFVHIANTANAFIIAAEEELNKNDRQSWLNAVDAFLEKNSWGKTWNDMMNLVKASLKKINNNILI